MVAGAAVLAVMHVLGAKLRFIAYVPRSGWLSFAGGISVAYVFLHLLPELAKGARAVSEEVEAIPSALAEDAVWVIALLGLAGFYGLEVAARRSRGHVRGEGAAGTTVFWFSVASFALYNALIGYLLHERSEAGFSSWLLFVIALALHFVVNDFSLREHHKHRYEAIGRWILVGAIAAGAVVGFVAHISEVALAALLAVIAGGVVLNVMKEELPTEAESRFRPFLAGVAGYAVLLLAL